MADDDPATSWDLYLYGSNALTQYRARCQNRLASLTMLPPDFYRYTRLIGSYLSGSLTYAEFSHQMFGDLLLPNPNYAHLCVYWAHYHRVITENIQWMDNPLFTFPIILYANMGLPIAPDDIEQLKNLVSALWNQVPEQSRVLIPQQVRDLQLAYQQEVDRIERSSRRQEMASQQQNEQMARQQSLQQEMTCQQFLQQEMARQQFQQQEMARQQFQQQEMARQQFQQQEMVRQQFQQQEMARQQFQQQEMVRQQFQQQEMARQQALESQQVLGRLEAYQAERRKRKRANDAKYYRERKRRERD